MDIKFLVYLCSIASSLGTSYGWNQHYGYQGGAGNSEYIHSNDTMALSLHENTPLNVEGGSTHDIELIFENRGTPSHFSFSKTSEDGLGGRLQKTEAFLQSYDTTAVRISGLRIPDRPHNSKVSVSVTVSRDSPIVKRSAQGQGGQIGGQGGQGGAMGGGGGFYPNGNDNRFPNRNPNFWNDPSNRREITLTVEFTVVDPDEAGDTESHDPRIEAVYAAKEKADTCREVSSSFCGDKWWWVQFTTWDSGSGIRKIDMDKSRQTNGGRPDFDRNQDDIVYYRYKSFVIGTDDEVEVVAGTSCCNDHMRLVVTDVDGNMEEFTAKSDKYGESTYVGNLTKTAFWSIIGAAIALVLIIIAVSIWCCVKNKCQGYSNPNT